MGNLKRRSSEVSVLHCEELIMRARPDAWSDVYRSNFLKRCVDTAISPIIGNLLCDEFL